jgi:ACR3 family arsenite transporter
VRWRREIAMQQDLIGRLSILDRFIPLWIFLAMALGLGAGYLYPEIAVLLDALRIDTVSLPIALGLLWMMYPILANVKYEELGNVARSWRMFGVSLLLNWLVGPFLMFGLAWLLLPDLPEYRVGLIIIGLARCIAMVLVWNLLAGGDNERCAVLVALNSIFQVLLYSAYAYFLITVVSTWVSGGESAMVIHISFWDVARAVLIFLGIPLVAGLITRFWLLGRKGRTWYEERFIRPLRHTPLLALLFTILVMFSLKGEYILTLPMDVLRIALPLIAYFVIMFGLSYLISWLMGFVYSQTATLSFTAASNNFELAIAVAVGVFGLNSGQALAAVVGPLIEVPVLISLVYVSLWARRLLFNQDGSVRRLALAAVDPGSRPGGQG